MASLSPNLPLSPLRIAAHHKDAIMSLIKTAKQQLRSHIKLELKKISHDEIVRQSHCVYNTLVAFDKFKTATKIGIYMNMPDLEVQTLDIIKTCFEMGKTIYLPKCIYEATNERKKFHLQMLKMNNFQEIENLTPQGKFKLLEPINGEDLLDVGGLDLLIIPGVAFTNHGQRLGHGAGFYDEFLNVYRGKYDPPFTLGLGLQQQLVDHIPMEQHDWALDGVIINDHIYQ